MFLFSVELALYTIILQTFQHFLAFIQHFMSRHLILKFSVDVQKSLK